MSAEIEKVAAIALELAAFPPVRPRGPATHLAQVPWATVERLRQALEEAGVDWRAFKREAEAVAAVRRQRQAEGGGA